MVEKSQINVDIVANTLRFKTKTELSILAPLDIVTIYEIKRVTTGSCDLFVDNIGKDKKLQVGAKIGNPIAF